MPVSITTVAATTVPLVTNNPDVVAKAVFDAILGDIPIQSSIYHSMTYGFNFKTDLFFNYAKNYYTQGLPSIYMQSENQSDTLIDDVTSIIENLYSITTLELQVEFQPPDFYDLLYDFITHSPDFTYSAAKPEPHINSAYSFTEIATGITYSPYGVDNSSVYSLVGSNFIVDMPHMVAGNPTGLHPNLQLNIPLNMSASTMLYYVRYTQTGVNGYTSWIYNPDTNVYPELAVETEDNLNLNTFPIIPIRYNNENYVDYASEEDVSSLETMLRFINIDLQDFTENLTDPDNTSDIDDIDDMFLMFSADVNENDDDHNQYLYEHFRQIKYVSKFSQQDYIDAVNSGLDPSDVGFPNNKFSYHQHNVRLTIKYNYITAKIKGGNVGDPQPLHDPMVLVTGEAAIEDDADNNGEGVVTSNTYIHATIDDYGTNHFITFRRQLDDTQFMEIVVHGLRSVNYVRNGNDIIIRNLSTMGDGGLFIPLIQDVVKGFNGIVETNIYYKTLNITIYAVEITKLDWYENPNFINAVGIFIVVVSTLMGLEDIGTLIAEGVSTYAIINEIAINILIDIVFAAAFEEVVELVGAENGLILAFIVAVISGTVDDSTLQQFGTIFDAEILVKAVTALIEAVNTVIQDDFLKLQAESKEFLEDAQEAQERLEAAQDLLDTGVDIDLYTLISNNTYTNFYESPNGYYERTIHNTNPGVATFDSVHNFFDTALRLPNLT